MDALRTGGQGSGPTHVGLVFASVTSWAATDGELSLPVGTSAVCSHAASLEGAQMGMLCQHG